MSDNKMQTEVPITRILGMCEALNTITDTFVRDIQVKDRIINNCVEIIDREVKNVLYDYS